MTGFPPVLPGPAGLPGGPDLNAVVVCLGLLALGFAALLRAPRKGSVALGALAFLVGLGGAVLGVRMAHDAAGLGRITEYDRFVAHGVELTGEAPTVLFVGSSVSRNAVDDTALTAGFRAAGAPHQAINLSLQGASYFERLSRVERYIALTGKAPEIVFLEVSREFDTRPAFAFKVGKFSARAIDQFTPLPARLTGEGLLAGQCPGLKDCVIDGVLLPVHAGMNAVNLGLANMAAPIGSADPHPAFDALTAPLGEPVDPLLRRAGLSARAEVVALSGPDWAQAWRTQERARLAALGVNTVAYYFPPVISAEDRAYAAGLCAGELSQFTCLAAHSDALLEALDGDVWADPAHMMAPGAALYTAALGEAVRASGLLGTPAAPRADADIALRPRQEGDAS